MTCHARCVLALRMLAVDQIEEAQSGHPGVALGFADVLAVLWRKHLSYNPEDVSWLNRDRFVLSNGHASSLYYALLHFSGFDLSLDDLKKFRKLGSKTPGHPERNISLGIDVTTGPLGQGLANAVGIALGQLLMADKFNTDKYKIFDYRTYVALGDGCLMEGISHEAASLAGTYGLGNLIVCWDDNKVSIDGNVEDWFDEDVASRFRSYGWHVVEGIDGHDEESIDLAIIEAKKELSKPSLLCFRTKIGFSCSLSGDAKCHGKPLGKDIVGKLRSDFLWNYDPFDIPKDIYSIWGEERDTNNYTQWKSQERHYSQTYPQLWRDLCIQIKGDSFVVGDLVWEGWSKKIQREKQDQNLATRKASQDFLEKWLNKFPQLIGGSADLAESTGVLHSGVKKWLPKKDIGNFIHFGVREFAMFAIANGLATCSGIRPYVSTFLVFSDYGINAVRMASMMKLPVVFVFSHDSIAVGEDGPTHQPIEHLTHLRCIPNLTVWRPADAYETSVAWKIILEDEKETNALVLTRQKVGVLNDNLFGYGCASKGGYIVYMPKGNLDGILLASGSEVHDVIAAAKILLSKGVSVMVVSMPSMERFLSQSKSYQDTVIPPCLDVRLAVELGTGACWYRFVSGYNSVLSINRFGLSGSFEDIYKHLFISVENIVERFEQVLEAKKKVFVD